MGYSTSDVSRLLGLPPSRIRGFIRAGFLEPERDASGQLTFSFQDLVVLRTARGLASGRVPPRRIRSALERLRAQLPEGRPLTAVRIGVEGGQIVAEDGTQRWQPESGQTLFDFGGGVPPERSEVAAMPPCAPGGPTADDWYEQACELEANSPSEAASAYRNAIALDPGHADAHVNLGRLLHESGDAAAAEPHYEAALAARPDDAIAAFNLGVALEDLDRLPEARLAYLRATRNDPENADAHYNAAVVSEKLGRADEALRYLQAYRKLTRKS